METKNCCLECVVHLTKQNKNQKRCIECPDKRDYLLRSEGKESFHRGFAPDKLGFEPYDILKNAIDAINKQKEPDGTKKDKTTQGVDKNLIKTCKKCGIRVAEKDINEYFQKNHKTKDGYLKTCKKCMKQKAIEGRKKAERNKQEVIKPSNEAPPKPDNTVDELIREPQKTCKECGFTFTGKESIEENFSPHSTSTDKLMKVCKNCHAKTMCNVIHVDFTNYPELLEKLHETAIKDFRSPDKEILAILDTFLENEEND